MPLLVLVGPQHVLNVRLRDLQPGGGVPDHFGALDWGKAWALSLGLGGGYPSRPPPAQWVGAHAPRGLAT